MSAKGGLPRATSKKQGKRRAWEGALPKAGQFGSYGVRPGQNTLSLFDKDGLYKDIAFKLKINKDGKASKSESLRHHNSSIIYIDD